MKTNFCLPRKCKKNDRPAGGSQCSCSNYSLMSVNYSDLSRAVTDDDKVPPGYIYNDIASEAETRPAYCVCSSCA